jgi:hypothetical protein
MLINIYMKHCFNINLPIHPLKEGIDLMSYVPNLYPTTWAEYCVRLPISDLNPEIISFVQSLGLRILLAEHFYTPPGVFSPIHTDLWGGDFTKINYIFGGKDSTMQWYNVKDTVPKKKDPTPYVVYDINDVDLVHTSPIGFPTIVQVGTPHNVQNYDEPRHCISVVLKNKNNQRLTMQESIDIFQQYIK